jgi:hypothetical protein
MKEITPPESIVPIYLIPPTEEELTERKKLQLEAEQRASEEQDKIDAKESALAKLAKLGLTEEEAKAVIGI